MALPPRESAEYIVKKAEHIMIKEEGILKIKLEIVQNLTNEEMRYYDDTNNYSQHELHPKQHDKNAVNWIFLLDSLNFCFWSLDGSKKWEVNGDTGYFALCAAIKRAIDEGINITDPKYYKNITKKQLLHIFRSDDKKTIIPLIDERLKCLHEVGEILLQKFDGNFENCIKLTNNSAKALLELIVKEFPSYRDEADYKGLKVSFYKRAQILIGDIWLCYNGEGLGKFDDIDTITMFADYRVPQVLLYFNALEYSEQLSNALLDNEILKSGDYREIEIRGASIYLVEKIKEKVLNELEEYYPETDRSKINSVYIDNFLWYYRRQNAKYLDYIPFHKVLGIYY